MPLLEEISEMQGEESDNCMANVIAEEHFAIIWAPCYTKLAFE